MRAVVYTRQSLDKTGEGAAVSRQLEDALKLAALRDWTVVEQFSDNDTSAAGKRKRPGFDAMVQAVEAGRADVIIAWSLDRLTRNRRDLMRLIETGEQRGTIVALVRGSDLDMSTPAGRLVADMLGGVARHEIDQKSDRQKRAQQQAAQAGRPSGGRRPFGYARDMVTICEPEAELVREGYAALIRGGSLKSIARKWNDLGVTTTAGNAWNHSNVRDVFLNPRYAGLRAYRGEIVGPAVWEALVDRDTYDTAHGLLKAPDRRTTTDLARKYLLPSLALCGVCGSDMATGHTRHGKRVYVCRAKKCISRSAEPVDALIEGGLINGIRVRGLVVERLSQPDALALLSRAEDDELGRLRSQRSAVESRMEDLATALADGLLPLAAVRKSSDRLREEMEAIDQQIHSATHADVLGPLATADDVEAAWAGYDLKQRRAVVQTLMTVTILPPPRGRTQFDPETVHIEWKGLAR